MATARSSSMGTKREADRRRRRSVDGHSPMTSAVTAIGFRELTRRLGELELPPIDLVVGIGRGGVVPAALAAQRLACDLRILPVRFRDDAHQPERTEPLVTPPAFDVAGQRVLLVDDVARTGATLRAAAGALAGAAAIHTLVVAGCADYALFQVDSCIAWPWQA